MNSNVENLTIVLSETENEMVWINEALYRIRTYLVKSDGIISSKQVSVRNNQ